MFTCTDSDLWLGEPGIQPKRLDSTANVLLTFVPFIPFDLLSFPPQLDIQISTLSSSDRIFPSSDSTKVFNKLQLMSSAFYTSSECAY